MKKRLFTICAGFSVAVFCYLFLLLSIIMYFNAPNSYHREDKRFIIESGMTLRQVVEKLHSDKIVKNPTAFLYIAQLIKGIDPKVRYGEYFFEKNLSYYKILHKMTKGNIFFRKVTVAEGLSSDSALKAINRANGLIGQTPERIKEGSILPETYFYSYNDTKVGMIKRMQDAMQKNLDELWEKRDLSIPVKTKEQALVLASIVEKETGIASERPKVASVFVNRLRKGMKLQSDPTIIYSFTFGDKSLERPIRVSDIQNNSPFNTYHIFGLPPAPICNPGLESIKAVLNPIQTDYIFFVASGSGDHIFATTIQEHNANVARYRSIMKSREQAAPAAADAAPAAVN
ncbi:MAG: endolytic transglycosylase MltG [Rickettsiales bacterium]|nr:endolytic transglycosylase MltG [Rickettsiales bacterium]